jgi:alpha-galactosidase
MTQSLENSNLHLSIDPDGASWSVFSRLWDGAQVKNASLGVVYRRSRTRHRALARWTPFEIENSRLETSPHGQQRQIEYRIGLDAVGLHCKVTFSLPLEEPFLLWQISLTNGGTTPIFIDEIELLRVGYPSRDRSYIDQDAIFSSRVPDPFRYHGLVQPHAVPGDLSFFVNGWGSWSRSGVYQAGERAHRTHLGFLRTPITINSGSPRTIRRGHFASEMYGVLGSRTGRTAILAGFLSQRQHFSTLETWISPAHPSLRMWAHGDGARLDPGQTVTTDWACLSFIHLDHPDPLRSYLEAVGREHGLVDPGADIPTGWASWYQYYDKITSEIIRANLASARQLRSDIPLDIIQIDDGFQTRIGDWSDFTSGFPDGVTPLASEISQAGFTPGLWLAPFLVDRRSMVARDHPDWLLRNRFGIPVNAGYAGSGLATGLDLTNESALNHAAEVIDRAVHTWGYRYLKLDFLYAGALPGRRHDPTRTRAQALRGGLHALREAAGDQTIIVGCGCPLGPAIGLCNAMRIGPDVAEFWRPRYRRVSFFFSKEPDIPAVENSIQNVLARAQLHRRWWINDPDCLLIRAGTELSVAEVRLLASVIALTGGSMILSDDLAGLEEDRLQLLKSLLPPIGERPHIIDWFDRHTPSKLQLDLTGPAGRWHILGLFNWGESPADLSLDLGDFFLNPQQEHFASSFWENRIYRIDGMHTFHSIPAHGGIVAAIRPVIDRKPAYLGGNLHISQGLEVTASKASAGVFELMLERPGDASGEVLVYLPGELDEAVLNGNKVAWTAELEGVYRLAVRFNKSGSLRLVWQ